ncbi:hypothetical protein As57867_005919, partial [Aphanomyces stellatus]
MKSMRVVPVKATAAPPPKRQEHRARWDRPFVYLALAMVMHLVISLYLAMWIFVILFARGPDLKFTRILWPQTTIATYAGFIGLHLYAIAVACLPQRRPQRRVSDTPVLEGTLVSFQSLQTMTKRIHESEDQFFIVFNMLEIACQSHQAYDYFATSVERSKAISYLGIVILYSFASPLILFVRNTRAKTTLINLADSIFSFALSCGHPMFAVVLAMLDYVLLNANLAHDNLWATRTALLARLLAISDVFDYICKCAMHLGTFIALLRFVRTLRRRPSPNHPTVADIPVIVTPRKRLLLRVNLWMNVAWACILTIVLVRSLALRHPCPSYCIADVRPLFDDTCQCAYANINCVALNATDPTEFLHPEDVGTHMFYLQISRCDLRTGLSQMSLTPFVNLNKLMLVYSNME